MFDVDFSSLMSLTKHSSYMFHVMIGIDPLGNFSAVEGLSYKLDTDDYKVGGRNHSPLRLPAWPGQVNEVTLRWGMIVRGKLFQWMKDVKVGGDFTKKVQIFQLSRRKLPLRVYTLMSCWPTQWEASSFSTESAAELATETLQLVCDKIYMTNLSSVAMLGDLIGSFFSFDAAPADGAYEDPEAGDALTPRAAFEPGVTPQEAVFAPRFNDEFTGAEQAVVAGEFHYEAAVKQEFAEFAARALGEGEILGEWKMERGELEREEVAFRQLETKRDQLKDLLWEQWPMDDVKLAALTSTGWDGANAEAREVPSEEELKDFLWEQLERVYVPDKGVWPQESEREAYEGILGVWDLVQQERKYEAQVGIWGEFEHLPRTYEAVTGSWGFEFEED